MFLAEPSPSPTSPACSGIAGPGHEYCESGKDGSGGTPSVGDNPLDPVSQLAKSVADAANWTATKLGKALEDRAAVDFTNEAFLKQYAVVFAASTVLVLVLWLLAVSKRAVRGVPMTTALGEAIGLLWLAVGVSAFAPLILFSIVGATSAVTDGLVHGLSADPGGLFTQMGSDLKKDKIGGGPVILALASVLTIALCGALILLLVLRALALYVGALLGVVVFSGLVSRDWWGKVRRWSGFMIGLILVEPILVIVLGLSAALQATEDTIAAGLVVALLALGATVALIWKFPGWGDGVKVARAAAGAAGGVLRTSGGAAGGVMGGIQAHGARGAEPRRTSPPSQAKAANSVAGGMSAHSSRTPKDSGDKK